MKTVPVIRRVHRSTSDSLSNARPTVLAPKAIKIANRKTGRPVPIPYTEGRVSVDPLCTDRGIRLPKNSAAETGQNESAKTIPKSPAPHTP